MNARSNGGTLPNDIAATEAFKQAIRDEPRRRMDHGHKRATEQDRHPNKPHDNEQEQEEEEEEQSKKEPRLDDEGAVALAEEEETKVAEEDEDSEPSSDEENDN